MPVFVGALDLTVVSAVLPAVIFELGIPLQSGLGEASWMVSGYLLTYALGIVIVGPASDIVGRRGAFIAALAVFALGSYAVATAREGPAALVEGAMGAAGARPDPSLAALYAVIAGRAVQGFAAGALVPVAMALVADLFPAGRRAFPLGVVGAVDTAGWVLGHLYGGLVVQALPWQAIFWVNLPVAAAGLVLAWRVLPRAGARARAAFDWPGAALASLALVALNLALTANEASRAGLPAPDRAPAYAGPALAAAAFACVTFVLVERRTRHPLIHPDLFRSAAAGINLLVGFALMVGLVSVPLLVNAAAAGANQAAALASGALLSALTVPLALAALAGGALVPRIGARTAAAAGLAAACAGFALFSQARPEAARAALAASGGPELAAAIGALLLAGTGLGLTVAPLAAVVIDRAPPRARGGAAAAVIVLRLLGMMVATSALTTYGVRRWAALSPETFAGIGLGESDRLLDAGLVLTSRIASEMALIAAAVCLFGLVGALASLQRGGR